MNRMEEEAEALGRRRHRRRAPHREARRQPGVSFSGTCTASGRTGRPASAFRARRTRLGSNWQAWPNVAAAMWTHYCRQIGWQPEPIAPWVRARTQAGSAFGQNAAEFSPSGAPSVTAAASTTRTSTASRSSPTCRARTSGCSSGRASARWGFVMGNCVYYVPPQLLQAPATQSCELGSLHPLALRRARARHRAPAGRGRGARRDRNRRRHVRRARALGRFAPWNAGNGALQSGEVIELFVIGTAVVPTGAPPDLAKAVLVLPSNDAEAPAGGGEGGE